MRTFKAFLMLLLVPILLFGGSGEKITFDNYFVDKTLRVDYYHTGNAQEAVITLDQVYVQGVWAGNPSKLIDRFNNGKYTVKLYDVGTNSLIFSRGYASIFNEYQTTTPALNGEKRSYHETVLAPFPRNPVILVIEARDKQNILHPVFQTTIDPDAVSIIREKTDSRDRVYTPVKNGAPHKKVDVVLVGEGYTEKEWKKFKADVDRYVKVFFSIEPYKSRRSRFNLYGVLRPSLETGVDEPRKKIFKNTSVNASFNALNLERYLLTEDNRSLRDVAGNVPYDAIILMVNSDRYGGGGIYNFYAMTTVNHSASENVFLHEFGHSFGGLGDEYYTSQVAYNDFYPRGVEPTEPNITALLNPGQLKWKALASPDVELPTDWGKERVEAVQAEQREFLAKMRKKIEDLKTQGKDEDAEKLLSETKATKLQMDQKIKSIRKQYEPLKSTVGAFEGAGYASEGLYRPMMECIMFSNREKSFCKVCERAIVEMIEFFTQ